MDDTDQIDNKVDEIVNNFYKQLSGNSKLQFSKDQEMMLFAFLRSLIIVGYFELLDFFAINNNSAISSAIMNLRVEYEHNKRIATGKIKVRNE